MQDKLDITVNASHYDSKRYDMTPNANPAVIVLEREFRRMRYAFILILIILESMTVCAEAATVKGIAVENELGGPGMSSVQIAAVAGANPTSTDALGRFTLEFPKLRPGDVVRLLVQRAGYEVVNDIQLELSLPGDPDQRPLTVLLCKQESREEMARRFYRLKSLQAVEETYQKQLSELRREQRTNAMVMARLEQERDQARHAAERASEELARQSTVGQPSSELYRRAMRLFLDGQVEAALKVLNDADLEALVAESKKKREEAEKLNREAVQGYLLKGQMLATRFDFEGAGRAYQAAVAAAPDSFDAQFAWAYFNQGLNRFAVARTAYEKCLKLAPDAAHVAMTLHNLGIVGMNQNRPAEARTACEEALKIYRELARRNPDTYRRDLAATLHSLGLLYKHQNRLEEARTAYEESLKIYRELAHQNPDTYLPDVAGALNNLGNLDRHQNRLEEARAAFDEALKIYREMARQNPDTYLSEMAMTLHNLGLTERAQNRLEEARTAYEESLKIYRELARQNPDTYLPNVASTLNALGLLDADQNRMQDARTAYTDALKIYRELARQNPDTYLPNVAMTLKNLGIVERGQKRLEEARTAFDEALKIYREVARQNSDAYLPDVATTLNDLGIVKRGQKRLEEAHTAFDEALKIYREVARQNPDTYLLDVARMLNNLGIVDRDQNRLEEARAAFDEALKIYRELARLNPDRFGRDVERVEKLSNEIALR